MSKPKKQPNLQPEKLKKIIHSNGFLFSAFTLFILLFMLFELPPLSFLEKNSYDWFNALTGLKRKSPVVLVEIDDKSIKEIGPWPWPRSYIADMTKRMGRSKAKAIGIDLLYTEKEVNKGIDEIKKIRKSLRNKKGVLRYKTFGSVDKKLRTAAVRLDNDKKLIGAIRSAKKVVLPLQLTTNAQQNKQKSLTKWLIKHTLPAQKTESGFFTPIKNLQNPAEIFKKPILTANSLETPFKHLSDAATALGHNNNFADADDTLRKHPLLILHKGRLFPSFSLQLAFLASQTRLRNSRISHEKQGFTGIVNGNMKISTDRQLQIHVNFDKSNNSFARYSFSDVINGKIPSKAFRNKAVIIGLTANDLYKPINTPTSENMSPTEAAAHFTSNILLADNIKRPGWAWLLEAGVLLYFMLFLIFVIPKVNLKTGSLILGIFLATWFFVAMMLYVGPGYWFQVHSPLILSILSLGTIQIKRKFFAVDRVDENTETNKMLGLSFQSQGMLDMAFDKFMKCSLKDPSVKDLLYNLGLDFERKRMHNKAAAVYEYILRGGKFKDTKERVKKLKDASEIIVVGTPKQRSDATLMLDSVETKPTLGRYEVIKELGQGAIGTVYLGKDPKINREVAIKVLRYDEVSEEQLEEVKKRFYREAEAAGRLSHPNIVTIFDAGEDYDLTYMAMELLSGKDLAEVCRKKNKLSIPRILEIVGAVAEALDYAHKNGVVHRDIKPANIMILDDDQIKVADFGIARIVDSSRTQTGDILGTPNYMSPEQVAGKKVDGRSDLFSLGAVMYELLTGEKPFQSDTMASIMYNIANATYVPVKEVAPNTPDCCVRIVDKLLTKAVTKRFQSAETVKNKIKACLKEIE